MADPQPVLDYQPPQQQRAGRVRIEEGPEETTIHLPHPPVGQDIVMGVLAFVLIGLLCLAPQLAGARPSWVAILSTVASLAVLLLAMIGLVLNTRFTRQSLRLNRHGLAYDSRSWIRSQALFIRWDELVEMRMEGGSAVFRYPPRHRLHLELSEDGEQRVPLILMPGASRDEIAAMIQLINRWRPLQTPPALLRP